MHSSFERVYFVPGEQPCVRDVVEQPLHPLQPQPQPPLFLRRARTAKTTATKTSVNTTRSGI